MLRPDATARGMLERVLDKCLVLAELEEAVRSRVLRSFKLVWLMADEVLFRQGDDSAAFYAVETGTLQVLAGGARSEQLREYTPGDFFGELSLMHGWARPYTVRAKTVCKLWALSRAAFRAVVAEAGARTAADRMFWLGRVPLLRRLPPSSLQRLADTCLTLTFETGERIQRRGELAGRLFLVRQGTVDVTFRVSRAALDAIPELADVAAGGAGDVSETVTLCPGQFFGGSSLLDPHAAALLSATARQRVTCDALDAMRCADVVGTLVDRSQARDAATQQLQSLVADFGPVPAKQRAAAPLLSRLLQLLQHPSEPPTPARPVLSVITRAISGIDERAASPSPVPRRARAPSPPSPVTRLARAPSPPCLPAGATVEAAEAEAALANAEPPSPSAPSLARAVAAAPLHTSRHFVDAAFTELTPLGVLGVGAYGVVKLVARRGTDERYALKCMSKARMLASGVTHHAVNEKSVLQVLDHPFVCKLHNSYQDSRYLYLLLELGVGGELFTALSRQPAGRFHEQCARFYAASVVEALAVMHDRRIAYRDLKLENLLLDAKGYLRVADFGLAKQVFARSWTLCGTPDYMSPEMVLGRGHDTAVDLWATGVLIFELCAGFAPFSAAACGETEEGADEAQTGEPLRTYHRILRGQVEYPAHFSTELTALLRELLTPAPALRLGNRRRGLQELRQHAWFGGLDWQLLRTMQLPPPVAPRVAGRDDMSNFDHFPADYGLGTAPETDWRCADF